MEDKPAATGNGHGQGQPQRKRRVRLRPWRLVAVIVFTVLMATSGLGAGLLLASARELPSVGEIEGMFQAETSFIYDAEDQLITEIHGAENRVPLDYDEIPQHVIDAFVAIEDERFWRHRGVDPIGIVRAALRNLRARSTIEGASTITQQLARNLFPQRIGQDISLRRKIKEAIMAIQLERHFSKERILEMYLNQVFFGHNAYGIEAAARVYFGKSAAELDIAEAATLAAVVKGTALYDPIRRPEVVRERRDLVLSKMAELGYITEAQAETAKQKPLETTETRRSFGDYPHPHFVDYVIQQLLEQFAETYRANGSSPDEADQLAARNIYAGGLHIYTTLDRSVQRAAEQAVAEVMDRDFPIQEGDDNPHEAAAVVVDVKTGEILAMVGGRRHQGMLDFNRVTMARRQPGSAFKPIAVYAAALNNGWTLGEVVDDAPVTYQVAGAPPWSPQNYGREYRGLMTVREALRLSQNVPAVKILEAVGIEAGINTAQALGIKTLDTDESDGKSDLNLSTALGGLTNGVTPLDMAEAFGTFANLGVRQTAHAIRKVVDRVGEVILTGEPEPAIVMEVETAWLMNDLLKNVIYPHRLGRAGTGSGAALSDRRPAAGKTGTTSDYKDVWFVGYTPQRVAAVWIGHDQPLEMNRQQISSGRQPTEIWKKIMEAAHAELPVEDWPEPPNIVKVRICKQSGLLPGQYCPDGEQYTEVFLRGTEPTEMSDIWKPYTVCQEDPTFLYEPGCSCTPMEKVFLDRPPVEPINDKQVVQDMQYAPPANTCQAAPSFQQGTVRIDIYSASFQPNLIQHGATVGEPFTVFARALEAPARVIMPDFGVDVEIEEGATARITFVPERDGRFNFEVHVGNYRMPGYLTVRQASSRNDGGQTPPGDDDDGGSDGQSGAGNDDQGNGDDDDDGGNEAADEADARPGRGRGRGRWQRG